MTQLIQSTHFVTVNVHFKMDSIKKESLTFTIRFTQKFKKQRKDLNTERKDYGFHTMV